MNYKPYCLQKVTYDIIKMLKAEVEEKGICISS